MKNIELADSGDPESIAVAAQRSLVTAMRQVLADLKSGPFAKKNGLSWDQIDFFIETFSKTKPTIVRQEHEQ